MCILLYINANHYLAILLTNLGVFSLVVHFIAIADRKLDKILLQKTDFYHHSSQLWKNVFVLVNKQTVEEVSALQKVELNGKHRGRR